MSDPLAPTPDDRRLAELRAAHRALDEQIAQRVAEGAADQLELQRMKKQKLALKDRIARLERDRLPDIIA
ncbi:MAG TPA: YdcH family protein [Geminicoccaceae bacterium]